jgi:hypothetical protein
MRIVALREARMSQGLAACLAIAAVAAGPVYGAACSAQSGAQAVPLVELYTSEGCSSCPPADRWLSATFAKASPRAAGIALAFHVDYWDRLGWKDRFAAPAYTERQYEEMRANGGRFVYTPQVVVQGKDFPEWQDRRAVATLTAASTKPARAEIVLAAERDRGSIAVKATARVPSPADRKGAVLYVALRTTGSRPTSRPGKTRVPASSTTMSCGCFGRARCRTRTAEIRWDVTLPVPAEAGNASTIVAFVQNARAGDVLQALALPVTAACATAR